MWRISSIDQEELEYSKIIHRNLSSMSSYANHFYDALMLFDFCRAQVRSSDWDMVACRDATMTVYHLGKTMELTRSSLKRVPEIQDLVVLDKIKEAGKNYKRYFPTFEKARHAVAHAAELFQSPEKMRENAASGEMIFGDGPFVSAIICSDSVSISNGLFGSRYVNTIDGKVVSLEMTRQTYINIYNCVHGYLSAFLPVFEKFSPESGPNWPRQSV